MKTKTTRIFPIALLAWLLACLPAHAQQITLKEENISLENALKKIEKQSGYTFFFKKTDIDPIQGLNINISNAPLKQALSDILKNRDFEFEVFDKTIVIKKVLIEKIVLRGKVQDENGMALKNILVEEQYAKTATLSGDGGEFTIPAFSKGRLSISGMGFTKKIIEYADSAYLTVNLTKSKTTLIDLETVEIKYDKQKQNPTKFVDLTNRNYMNLSQVLQGTVPGLSLQTVTTSSKEIISIDAFVYYYNGQYVNNIIRMTVDEFLAYMGRDKGQQIIDILLAGTNVPTSISSFFRLNTTTKIASSLVPQIRGVNNFINSNNNMLVVIDGFPQDGFPADYPMINVESIEVEKDPKELVKWGAKAAGGAILIKTKSARKGRLQVNYSSNFYYSPTPRYNRQKLQLASTAEYLDYLQDVDSIFSLQYTDASYGFTPARRLLAQKRESLISDKQFNTSWDSLKSIDNSSQLGLLQQDKMSQNHTLSLNGGNKTYRFNLIGNYSHEKSDALEGYSNSGKLSWNNDINLFKNKLQIKWLINYANVQTRTGYSFSPTIAIEPYQLLLDNAGNYVYDYSSFSPSANATITANGYKDMGINLLQDARVNKNLSRQIEKKSNMNIRWELAPGLAWSTSIYYTGRKNVNRTLYGASSSYVRQLVNNYGEYTAGGVNFYVPYGDILTPSSTAYNEWNVRSGLSYTKVIGKHSIGISAGAGGANISSLRPSTRTIYGYNSATGQGSPVFLPTPDPTSSINNYYSLLPDGSGSVNLYSLTMPVNGDSTRSRNVNANANVTYKYGDRLSVTGTYMNVYNPLYGQEATYSVMSSYKGEVTGLVARKINRFFNNILLSAGTEGTKLPDLPQSYNNTRYQQVTWNNYTIWVSGTSPTQQHGQSSVNIYEKMTLTFMDSAFLLKVAYNTQKIDGQISAVSTDETTTNQHITTKYMSAGIAGRMRKGRLIFQADYSKSPEGQTQVNGTARYDIAHEKYFHSKRIDLLEIGAKLEDISAYQGLGLMMETNTASNGSYSQATNSSFTTLPPHNVTYEVNAHIGINANKHELDLRYYHQSTYGINNYLAVETDPTTGLANKTTYSNIINKGIEFYLKLQVIKVRKFEYSVTLNGAYNINVAKDVPVPAFYLSDSYTTAYRSGYNTSNLWSVKWAGLNNEGEPQIYDAKGQVTTTLDSANIASSMRFSGVTRPPWTGGFIHDIRFGQFFARTAFTFSFGHVMRTYTPYPGNNTESSRLIQYRWRKPGDELYTSIPKISQDAGNSNRSFVSRNGTNSITTADNIRWQEIMIGYNVPPLTLKQYGISAVTIALTTQNVAVWARNPQKIDPATVSGDGRVGMPIPKIYSCNLNVSF